MASSQTVVQIKMLFCWGCIHRFCNQRSASRMSSVDMIGSGLMLEILDALFNCEGNNNLVSVGLCMAPKG